ncbi:sugar ABC transporter substrate-binding protein [Halobacillus litoralis]|uniref:ABC transporter substrate-binding protein n=1 Tax=Halobacillus litoralis TaxID=45668 RepID=UPI001CD4954E|nr:sugar ABC transporter substrate-binding protein [Halobacillus litoralis]MCA0970581.1 sugar ABC transporter substrate-binding protein [Halobacillus litoralis]
MKKFSFLLGLMVTMVLVLAACSGSSEEGMAEEDEGDDQQADAGEQVEIEFWTMQLKPTFTDYIEGVISDFEEENENITVKWVDVPWGDMEKKILSAVASETAPDVANLNPQFASQLAELDALINMDEAVPSDKKDEYFEGIWKSNSFGGETFGIPWYLSSQVSMYNKDIFEAAGLTEEDVPTKFSEVMEISKTIKEETGNYAFFPSIDGSHLLEMMVTMGVDLTNEDMTEATFNTAEGKEAFQFFVDLYENELIPREVLTEGHGKAVDMYQAGQLAILASGPQFLNTVNENAPDIYEATGVAPVITGETNLKNVAAMNLVVPKQSDKQDAAVQFSLFMTNAENQVEFDKIVPILPSIETALDDPYFNELPENPSPEDTARIISAEQLKDSEVLVPPMKNYSDLQKAMTDALQAAMLGEMSVDDALADAEQKWNAALQ